MQTLFRWMEDRPWRLPAFLLLIGGLERIGWMIGRRSLDFSQGEAGNVAIAFARSGEIADVFGKGSGLTAHITPVLPVFAGAIYKAFGIRSAPAELILAMASIGLAMTSAALLYRIFGELGVSRRSRIIALALFCIVPLNLQLEAVTFRIWEGALAAALGAWCLLLIVRADKADRIEWRQIILLSLLAAILFFVSPPFGLALYINAFILMIRRVALTRWPAVIAIAILALMAVLTPWTIRNYQAFDRFIPLRSNFGLELALANHPAAANGGDDYQVFWKRLNAIHPLQEGGAFERMQVMGGERIYSDRLGEEAKHWIAEHPVDFARISAKHLLQFYFPPSWQWNIYGNVSKGTQAKMLLSWAITLVGLFGALAALIRWRGAYLYVACIALVPALPYIITQPVPRYRYLVFAPLLFLGVELVSRFFSANPRRVRAETDKQDA